MRDARVHLSNFSPEILSLIFSHVDTATLLDAVPHVCRDWRTACSDDVYGPNVRLKLRNVHFQNVTQVTPKGTGKHGQFFPNHWALTPKM